MTSPKAAAERILKETEHGLLFVGPTALHDNIQKLRTIVAPCNLITRRYLEAIELLEEVHASGWCNVNHGYRRIEKFLSEHEGNDA